MISHEESCPLKAARPMIVINAERRSGGRAHNGLSLSFPIRAKYMDDEPTSYMRFYSQYIQYKSKPALAEGEWGTQSTMTITYSWLDERMSVTQEGVPHYNF